MPNGLKLAIAGALGVLMVILVVVMLKRSGANADAKLFNEMMLVAGTPGANVLPVDERRLDILLRSATSVSANTNRDGVYVALTLAKATDGTNVDARIAEVATTQEMIPNVRIILIRDVLRIRANPAIIGTLLDFARTTNDTAATVAAIEATRNMAGDEHFPDFLRFIQQTKEESIRKAAEDTAGKIIDRSSLKTSLASTLTSAYGSAQDEVVRHAILRLLGRVGGDQALALTQKNLESSDMKDKIAAIAALGSWEGGAGFEILNKFLESGPSLDLRKKAFDTVLLYASEATENIQQNWTMVSKQAKTQDEQLKLIRGLVSVEPAPWVYAILQGVVTGSDYEEAVDLAERAIIRLKDIEKTQGGN